MEKVYSLGTFTNEQWIEIHQELIDGSLLGREVECCDHKDHSPTRGEFLLTDDEATTIKSDARIKYINLSPASYPDTYYADPDDLKAEVKNTWYYRYSDDSSSKQNWQHWANAWLTQGTFDQYPGAETVGRASSQLLRMAQYYNPWNQPYTDTYGSANPTYEYYDYIDQNPQQKGAGEHVDVIVADNGTWIGHVEFINPKRASGMDTTVSPEDYIGGNPISDVGYCDVLDVVLDGPFYIDPDWFNVQDDYGNYTRRTTRFDGTVTAEESAARLWWSDSSARSAKFASIGTTATISSSYTRNNVHGSKSQFPTSPSTGDHGTQCASLCYGRTHGWAYNCNKWHINLYGTNNTAGTSLAGIEIGFDIIKIFHQNKPINSIYGTQDPTLMSNSWGFRAQSIQYAANYYYYRSNTGISYSSSVGNRTGEPEFMKYLGTAGDNNRFKTEMYDNSMSEAGKELVDSGVIFVVAAGNSNQTQVNPDDPEYDNHISKVSSSDGVYADSDENFFISTGSFFYTGTTNRRGFPQHVGKTESQTFAGNTTCKFPAINVGALDDFFSSNYRERKVNYSDMGNAIDIYAPGDGTLAATREYWGNDYISDVIYGVGRYDNRYDDLEFTATGFFDAVNSQLLDQDGTHTLINYNTGYWECRDVYFNGTSAACPVACGFLATIVQYNRSWTYEDIRSWLQTSVTPQVTSVDNATAYPQFYDAARGTTASSSSWSDLNGLQGGTARVLYLADYAASTPYPGGAGFRGGFTLKKCGLRRKT